MKRFSTTVLVVVSLSFAALKMAHAQAKAEPNPCFTKCKETFKTCNTTATTPAAKEACRKALKTCVLACPKK